MNTILAFLAKDHRACDSSFADAESAVASVRWADADTAFRAFAAAMAHHFAMEEEVLFPAFEAKTGMRSGPTQVMRMEHAQMRRLIHDMGAALDARDVTRYLGLSETLNMLMQQHNVKEESMLYPMADRTLGEAAAGVVEDMQAVRGADGE